MNTVAATHLRYAFARADLRVANVLKRGKSEAMSKYNTTKAAWQRALSGQPPLEHYDADFFTTVAGIPCGVVVDDFRPGCAARLFGPPENCSPEEPAEADFILVDRKGYRALWLERRLKSADRSRIEQECIDHCNRADPGEY